MKGYSPKKEIEMSKGTMASKRMIFQDTVILAMFEIININHSGCEGPKLSH